MLWFGGEDVEDDEKIIKSRIAAIGDYIDVSPEEYWSHNIVYPLKTVGRIEPEWTELPFGDRVSPHEGQGTAFVFGSGFYSQSSLIPYNICIRMYIDVYLPKVVYLMYHRQIHFKLTYIHIVLYI